MSLPSHLQQPVDNLRAVLKRAAADNLHHIRGTIEFNLRNIDDLIESNSQIAESARLVSEAAQQLLGHLAKQADHPTIGEARLAAYKAIDGLEALLAEARPNDSAVGRGLGW